MTYRMMATYKMSWLLFTMAVSLGACVEPHEATTDERQAAQQAQTLNEAHKQIGMPAVRDFNEKRLVKDLYELRDKPIPTHSYLVNELKGCLVYLGASVGYGIPYATQYTAPTKTEWYSTSYVQPYLTPQAEPNGLFMPSSAEGTWLMLKNPEADETQAVYVEPRVVVSPFRLKVQECQADPVQPPAKKVQKLEKE